MKRVLSFTLSGNPPNMFAAVKDSRLKNLDRELAEIYGVTIRGKIKYRRYNPNNKHFFHIELAIADGKMLHLS